MIISEWIKSSTEVLNNIGIKSARLDSLLLAEYAIDKNRTYLMAHGNSALDKKTIDYLNVLLARRYKREPLAYITNKAWFYGREFFVNEHVLIPRPESEDMITLALELCRGAGLVVDVGTGSGCLAITAAIELNNATVVAIDVSKDALEVARKNAYSHQTKIKLSESFLLEDIPEAPDLILANLPYVPEGLITSPEIEQEPEVALFSGKEGLDLYQSFWAQIGSKYHNSSGPLVITESLLSQHNDMIALAASANYHLVKTLGLAQAWKRG